MPYRTKERISYEYEALIISKTSIETLIWRKLLREDAQESIVKSFTSLVAHGAGACLWFL